VIPAGSLKSGSTRRGGIGGGFSMSTYYGAASAARELNNTNGGKSKYLSFDFSLHAGALLKLVKLSI
jgi:hypothetical protein